MFRPPLGSHRCLQAMVYVLITSACFLPLHPSPFQALFLSHPLNLETGSGEAQASLNSSAVEDLSFWSSCLYLPGGGFLERCGCNPGLHVNQTSSLPTELHPSSLFPSQYHAWHTGDAFGLLDYSPESTLSRTGCCSETCKGNVKH